MQETITIRPTIRKSELQRLAGGNLNKWINGLIEQAVRDKDCDWSEFLKRPRRVVRKSAADELRHAER